MYHYLPPILSTFFRIDTYIYLWIASFIFVVVVVVALILFQIPSRVGALGLPSLYFLYLLTLHSFPLPQSSPPIHLLNGEAENPPTVHEKKNLKHRATNKGVNAWSTLFFSLQTHNIKLTLANIFINTLLLAAILDFTITPFLDAAHDVAYTRIGAVYPDSVKIQVRHPASDVLVIMYREASNLEWKQGPKVQPRKQFDWVETVRLDNLWPSTKYEC